MSMRDNGDKGVWTGRSRTAVLLSACALALGCSPQPAPATRCLQAPPGKGTAVAQVGDVSITVDDIVQRVLEQGHLGARRYGSEERVRELVEDQIRVELLARAALDRGLANDPEVVAIARKVLVRRLLQTDLGDELYADPDRLSDDELRTYYERHRNDYVQPEKRRVSHILLPDTAEGERLARQIIDTLLHAKDERAAFLQAVAEHSRDPRSRKAGGDLLYASLEELTNEYGAELAGAVFQAPVPTLVARPVRSAQGWHVIHVAARREALTRDFSSVRDELRERLLKGQRSQVFDDYLAQIRRRYPVALYDEHLDEVLAKLQGSQ